MCYIGKQITTIVVEPLELPCGDEERFEEQPEETQPVIKQPVKVPVKVKK